MVFLNKYFNPHFVPDHNRGIKQIVSNRMHSSVFFGYGPKGSMPDKNWFGTDRVKNKETIKALNDLGADELMIPTPDGDRIHATYLDAGKLESRMNNVIESDKKGGLSIELPPDATPEMEEFVKAIQTLHMDKVLADYPEDYYKALPLRGPGSSPTVIICTGSGAWYSVYKPIISKLAMSGINVLAFNYRGFEKSEGLPTDEKIIEDVEACYNYLKQVHHLEDEDLLVYGSCFGAGPASALAKNHPGASVFIDRSFTEFRNVAKDMINSQSDSKTTKALASIVHTAMPHIIDYNVGKNLEQVTGHVGVMVASNEDFLEQEETEKLLEHMPQNPGRISMGLTSRQGHTGNWLNKEKRTNESAIEQFDQFLIAANFKRQPNFV